MGYPDVIKKLLFGGKRLTSIAVFSAGAYFATASPPMSYYSAALGY